MPMVKKKKKKKTTLDGINSRLKAADEKLVNLKKSNRGTSPMVQWLRLHIPNAGALVRAHRSHMPKTTPSRAK